MKSDLKKIKEFRKFLKKFILKEYGRKCPDYVFDCVVCRVWRVYDDFNSWADDVGDLEKM